MERSIRHVRFSSRMKPRLRAKLVMLSWRNKFCISTSCRWGLCCDDAVAMTLLPDARCDSSWKRRPGRPNKRWLDQIRDNNRPPADVWRDTVRRGHSGATQRSTPTYSDNDDDDDCSYIINPTDFRDCFYDFLCSAVFVLIYPLNVDSFSMRMIRTLLLS